VDPVDDAAAEPDAPAEEPDVPEAPEEEDDAPDSELPEAFCVYQAGGA
jgi:hypothetical protein